MIKEGWGRLHYNPSSQKEKMKEAYQSAKENQRGIFGMGCTDTEPVDPNCRIKGNIDEDKQKKSYHLLTCRDYDRVIIDRDRGENYYCSEKEAQAAGFTKAYGCD